jgi:hypothetical protein
MGLLMMGDRELREKTHQKGAARPRIATVEVKRLGTAWPSKRDVRVKKATKDRIEHEPHVERSLRAL